MGIVLGRPAAPIPNRPNTPKPTSSKRSKKEKNPNNGEEDEMPEEFKDAMREAGLDPDDPADVKEFLKSLNPGGGRRKRKTRNKRRS